MIEIGPVRADEVAALRDLALETFVDTFASVNTPENLAAYVSGAFTIEQVESEYRTAGSSFYFARHNGLLAGYLKVNIGSAQTEGELKNSMEIQQIYARRAAQRVGVGSTLFRTALDEAKRQQLDWLWLGVWEHNANAIAFYRRHGFEAFDRHDFLVGTDRQTDIMMRLPVGGLAR